MKPTNKFFVNFLVISFLFFTNWLSVEAYAEEVGSTAGEGTITYHTSDENTPPVDPENPNEPVDPGEEGSTTGLLRFDYVPRLRFGAKVISDKDLVYDVRAQQFKGSITARPNYLQVTDLRGTLSGWQVSVRQETLFQNEKNKTPLKGAMLSFDKQWVNSKTGQLNKPNVMKDTIKIDEIGASYPLAIADKGTGTGTWTINFGSTGNVKGKEDTLTQVSNADGTPITDPLFDNKVVETNSAIQLFVPGQTEKKPGKYKTVLTWTLSELT